MNKTIENAENEYLDSADTYSYGCEENHDITEQMRQSFKAGVNALLSLPLAFRMTAEEKERVRGICDVYYNKWREHPSEATEAVHCAIKKVLESIFGKELFEEEGV